MPRFSLPRCSCVARRCRRPACLAQAFVEHLTPPVLSAARRPDSPPSARDLGNAARRVDLAAGRQARGHAGRRRQGRTAPSSTSASPPTPRSALFGLRVATADGLSNVHLCLIDDLPVRPAPDSAEGAGQGRVAVRPVGPLPRGGGRPLRHRRSRPGRRVSFEAVGNRLRQGGRSARRRSATPRAASSPSATTTPACTSTAASSIASPTPGTYTVEVRDSRFQGHEHGFYVLRMGRFPAAPVAVPAAVRPGKRADCSSPR